LREIRVGENFDSGLIQIQPTASLGKGNLLPMRDCQRNKWNRPSRDTPETPQFMHRAGRQFWQWVSEPLSNSIGVIESRFIEPVLIIQNRIEPIRLSRLGCQDFVLSRIMTCTGTHDPMSLT